MAVAKNQENLLAHCEYEEALVPAAIKKDNITGLQFHPEKSGEVGLKVLNKFMKV
jgi:glutamine amidotransferase